MSRNTEYAFLNTDPAVIEDELTGQYETICGLTVLPGSPEKQFIKWVAQIITQERAMANYAINQNVPSRAEGEHLDALAELFFAQERAMAKYAGCVMRFYISQPQTSAVRIPAGTRVTDEGQSLYWKTTEEAYITAGEDHIDLNVVCQSAGKEGNGWKPGRINRAVDLYDYYSACENLTESDGGTDEMTDEELYEAMRLSMDALSTAGAVGSYIYHAKAVSTEIMDVAVTSPQPGEVRIFALMEDGSVAGETMKEKILAACNADTVRPLTDHVQMEDPEEVEYDIDLTYYLPSEGVEGAEDIEQAVSLAIEEYVRWQGGRLGRDINPSRLIQILMATGIKRVDVRSPVFTKLEDGKTVTENPPQIAVARNISLTNGGMEDE